MGIAAVAIALIGFSGVVTALGRRESSPWTEVESIQLFALVVPSIVTLYSVFVPIGLQVVIESGDLVWRLSSGACFLGHLIGVTHFLRAGSAESILFSHKVGLAITFLVMAAMLVSAVGLGPWPELIFLLGLLLGIGVSLHNFYLLLLPAISSE